MTTDRQKGGATIVLVAAITIFVVGMAVFLVVGSNTSVFFGQTGLMRERAHTLAEAGIQDAIIKLARNMNFSGSYTLTTDEGGTDVNVASGTPVVVIATSTVSLPSFSEVKRTLKAEVTFNGDGKITGITKEEL